jgi:hypothetical protein
MKSGIFFSPGLDDPNQLEAHKEIKIFAHADFRVSGPGSRVTKAKTVPVRVASGKSVCRVAGAQGRVGFALAQSLDAGA